MARIVFGNQYYNLLIRIHGLKVIKIPYPENRSLPWRGIGCYRPVMTAHYTPYNGLSQAFPAFRRIQLMKQFEYFFRILLFHSHPHSILFVQSFPTALWILMFFSKSGICSNSWFLSRQYSTPAGFAELLHRIAGKPDPPDLRVDAGNFRDQPRTVDSAQVQIHDHYIGFMLH